MGGLRMNERHWSLRSLARAHRPRQLDRRAVTAAAAERGRAATPLKTFKMVFWPCRR